MPPIYLLVVKSPAVKDQFANIRFAINLAAPLGPEQQKAASAKLGGSETHIVQSWGLSESCGSATLMPYGEYDLSATSVSQVFPNFLVR